MLEESSNVIAVISALISCLAAVYARWQAKSGAHANKIAIHENRLRVYKGVLRFHGHICAVGISISDKEFWDFVEISEISEFYYPKNIADKLEGIVQILEKTRSLHWDCEYQNKNGREQNWDELARERNVSMKQARDTCGEIKKEMKPYLVVSTRKADSPFSPLS